MPLKIQIEKRFNIPRWDEVSKQKALDYWARRRVVFNETSANTLVGKRGNVLGNLTSFDMSKLMATVKISVSNHNEVHCILIVNSIFQQITEYNRAWWNLEMDTFESVLLRDDEQEEKWKNFGSHHKKAAWAWSLTSGLVGNKIPPDEKL